MTLSWSGRRKVLYGTVATVVVVVLLFTFWQVFLTNIPTCYDRAQNGDERGVDCGGACSLVCAADARPPVVLWSRVFNTAYQTYTAAAYVQNNNPGAGARQVRYLFQLFDDRNILVVERAGAVDLPAVRTIPIIEPNIDVGSRTVARALFAFSDVPVWETQRDDPPKLRTVNQELAPDGSRLSAVIRNEGTADELGVGVAAVLFDAEGVAQAASKTTLSRIPKRGSENVTFTWPRGTPGIVRAEITILPAL